MHREIYVAFLAFFGSLVGMLGGVLATTDPPEPRRPNRRGKKSAGKNAGGDTNAK